MEGEASTQEVSTRRQDIGYKYSLNLQEMICGEALTNLGASQSIGQYNAGMNYLMAALDALEDKLAPYHDTRYTEDKEGKYDKKQKKKVGGFENLAKSSWEMDAYRKGLDENPNVEPDDVEASVEATRLDALRKQQRKRYAALLKLMDRNNLLLEEETEDHAG